MRQKERTAFLCGWTRNVNGNLWKRKGPLMLVLFQRNGSHHWCINETGEAPRFSHEPFDSEDEAAEALLGELKRRNACGRG